MDKWLKELILKNIRKELKDARTSKGITLEEAAKETGLKTKGGMAHLESGRNSIKIDTFLELVNLYGIEVEMRYNGRTIIIN